VLAGCASPAAGPHAPGKVAVRLVVPPPGTRAEAEAFAQQMLSSVILPAGSRQLPRAREPSLLRTFAGDPVAAVPGVSPFRLCRLPLPMSAAISFVQSHLPRSETNSSWGQYLGHGDAAAEQYQYVDAQARTLPVGIDLGNLQYSVVPGRAGFSVLQVNAQVIWYPPRPAEEDFVASGFRAVKLVGFASHGREITKTLTSRQLIGKLVSLLDDLHVGTRPASTCGLLGADGSGLELLSASKSEANVRAFYGCPGYSIYLGPTPEPPLQPQYPKDKLWALITRLLGLPS
jgi:hypothetical protein